MRSIRHRLPPLMSLLVFESSARTLNFTRTAEELHVSQAAISKQIRQLEDFVGHALFERHGRRVTLSPRGQRLHSRVSASFNYLADAVEEVSARTKSSSVTLAANGAVSHYWLSEVLNDFRDQHPKFEASFRIVTSDHTPDLFDDAIDLAVVYDPVQRMDWSAELLFEEEMFPVASPEYIKRHPLASDKPEELLKHVLLDYERLEPNWINWSAWFEALGKDTTNLRATQYGNNYIVLVDAATRGHGVTLGTRHLLDREIRSGRLARISSLSVRSGRGYYLMSNTERPYRPEVEQLHAWLRQYCALQPVDSITSPTSDTRSAG